MSLNRWVEHTLPSCVNYLNESHFVVHQKLFPIRILYGGVISLDMTSAAITCIDHHNTPLRGIAKTRYEPNIKPACVMCAYQQNS